MFLMETGENFFKVEDKSVSVAFTAAEIALYLISSLTVG